MSVSDTNENMRLCITKTDLPLNTQYAALSHCWGQLEFLKLCRDNLLSLQKEILFQSLPKTFRDAIRTARRFGFRYLWIDSLCIIQDNLEDWSYEAPRMASVYGGSSFNIAATGASNGNEGLFFHRDIHLVKRCLVRARLTDTSDDDTEDSSSWETCPDPETGSDITDFGHEGVDEVSPEEEQTCLNRILAPLFHCIDGTLYDRNFNHLPLVQRAWVFQERFLAPRTLHFGRSQVMWECQTKICFETLPNGMQNDTSIDGGMTWVLEHKSLESIWESVVSQYSKCLLTNASDRQIAISGVAEWLAEKYGGNYIWGTWTEMLPLDLLWRLYEENTTSDS